MNKNPERTEATREKIKAAFWDIYERRSLKQITVREIAELAGVNRSTFYAYYKDVYDVLEQAEEEMMALINPERHIASESLLDQRHHREMLCEFGEFLKKNQKPLKILLGDKGDPKFSRRLWNAAHHELRENIAGLTGRRIESPYDEYLAEFVINCHAGILMHWIENGCDIPFEQVADITYKLMAGGIVPYLNHDGDFYNQIADHIIQRIMEKL